MTGELGSHASLASGSVVLPPVYTFTGGLSPTADAAREALAPYFAGQTVLADIEGSTYPAEQAYSAEPMQQAVPDSPVEPIYQTEPENPVESKYAAEPRYAADPSYPAEPAYLIEPVYSPAEPQYPAEPLYSGAVPVAPDPNRPIEAELGVENEMSPDFLDYGDPSPVVEPPAQAVAGPPPPMMDASLYTSTESASRDIGELEGTAATRPEEIPTPESTDAIDDVAPVWNRGHDVASVTPATNAAHDLAGRLESIAQRLRTDGTAAIVAGMRGDRFDALLAGLFAGYLAAQDPDS